MECHVFIAGIFLCCLCFRVIGCLDEVGFDDGALGRRDAEGFPEPFLVAQDAVCEDLGVKDCFDAALPDFTLFVEGLCCAQLLDIC